MTLANQQMRVAYLGNGATGTYAWAWLVYAATDLHVAVLDPKSNLTPLTLGIDYSIENPVTQIGANAGGNIVLSGTGFFAWSGASLPGGWALIIRRAVVTDQTTELDSQGLYDPAAVEGALDYLTMQTMQQQDQLARVVQLPLDDYAAPSQNVGTAAQRAKGYLIFDAYGNPYTTPALIQGVPANGTTVAGTPAVALSNLAEGLADKVNQMLVLTTYTENIYTASIPYGIYAGALFSVIWPSENLGTPTLIQMNIYPQLPSPPPPLTVAVTDATGTPVSIGACVAGTMNIIGYDGTNFRILL